MQLFKYTNEHKEKCLEIFKSNTPRYFAEWEYSIFLNFLTEYAENGYYYILICAKEIIGCGGFEKCSDEVELTWGMVHNTLHNNEYGSELLNLRIKKIQELFGNVSIKIETTQIAEGFFLKKGFSPVSRVRDGFGDSLDKIEMKLII